MCAISYRSKLTFWAEAKLLLKRMLKRPSASGGLPRSALAIAVENDDTVIGDRLAESRCKRRKRVIQVRDIDDRYPLVNYAARAGNLEIGAGVVRAWGRRSQTQPDGSPMSRSSSPLWTGISHVLWPCEQNGSVSKVLKTQISHGDLSPVASERREVRGKLRRRLCPAEGCCRRRFSRSGTRTAGCGHPPECTGKLAELSL